MKKASDMWLNIAIFYSTCLLIAIFLNLYSSFKIEWVKDKETFLFFPVVGFLCLAALFKESEKRELRENFNSKLPRETQLKIAENVEELIISMQNEIAELEENNAILLEHHDFFKIYYNEDWNRDTPFRDQINFGNRFLRYREILPLSSKISDLLLLLEEEEQNQFELRFFYNSDIKELPLGSFLMFLGDLKTFKANDPEDDQIYGAFYEHRLNFYTKK